MKKYINIIKYALMSAVVFSSCTDGFENMNTSPFGVTDEELNQDNKYIGSHFPMLEQSIYDNYGGWGWSFQTYQNLNADLWSGYLATGSEFKGNKQNEFYYLDQGWNNDAWAYPYNHIMPNQLKVTEKCEAAGMETYAHFNAINTVIRVLSMSRVCDCFGPIIYSKYGESATGGTYDSAEDAYKKFFAELTDAANVLYEYSSKKVPSFAEFDLAYGGDLKKWAKLANTIRLRLAMRVVKYNATWAQEEGEAAIKDPAGLLEEGESFTISGKGWKHPLYTCSIEYKNCFVSANIQSILEGYKDPRLNVYGLAAASGKVVGVRSGIPNIGTLRDQYVPQEGDATISYVNVTENQAASIIPAAEAYFLLAEAALRKWDTKGKTAKELYENGIAASFNQWGVSSSNYKNSSNTPANYVDPVSPATLNHAAMSQVTPNWDDATNDEERLEKIITQKWIAGFPEGNNAWAEWRRTGYPKLLPIVKNENQNGATLESGIRRIPFAPDEKANNPEGVKAAIGLLKGPDLETTRIFWDVDKANF